MLYTPGTPKTSILYCIVLHHNFDTFFFTICTFFLLMSYFLSGMDVVSSVWLLAIYPLSLFRRVRVRVIYYLSCLPISLSLPLCPCQSYHEVSELMSIY
ncbi:hypothetical protein B0J11DRAFT_142393 [Dendryphion nanum]|uniref:Uncharacterized protein n=1 Tax=Dendryphion nanum TaxID=256645 RepID=A0A9P9IAL7_9PLEO|nr:hypothetical protein B0J11DRAFT_142393 [Dendryphion nanum]